MNVHLIHACLAALAAALALPSTAEARGPSAAQRKRMAEMQKKMREQAQWQMQEMQRYQSEMNAKHAELAKQYDADGNGKLTGAEKSKFDKYMFDIQKGRVENPFAGILPPGQGPKPTAKK